jgi:hypothetical protein
MGSFFSEREPIVYSVTSVAGDARRDGRLHGGQVLLRLAAAVERGAGRHRRDVRHHAHGAGAQRHLRAGLDATACQYHSSAAPRR